MYGLLLAILIVLIMLALFVVAKTWIEEKERNLIIQMISRIGREICGIPDEDDEEEAAVPEASDKNSDQSRQQKRRSQARPDQGNSCKGPIGFAMPKAAAPKETKKQNNYDEPIDIVINVPDE